MKILEFGDTTKRKLLLIHGFQSPWQVWNQYIDYYKKDFHIIVPVMSGHNPEEKEDFISFEAEVIFDGSPLVSLNGLMRRFMKKFYLDITHKSQQRDKKTVEQATKVIISEDNLDNFLNVLDSMSDVTVKNSIDMIGFDVTK